MTCSSYSLCEQSTENINILGVGGGVVGGEVVGSEVVGGEIVGGWVVGEEVVGGGVVTVAVEDGIIV